MANKAFLKTSKILLITLLSIGLIGCGTVPIGSMYKIATMDENDIRVIDPKVIRTRLTLDSPAQLQTRNVRLVLRFEFHDDEESEYQFLLEPIGTKLIQEKAGWFANPTPRHQYEFQLAEKSVPIFRKYQREFVKYGKPRKYYWTVYYHPVNGTVTNNEIKLDLEIKFAQNEAFFLFV